MLKRLLCLFSVCIVLLSYSVPVFATGTEIGPYTGGGVGIPISLQAEVDVVDLFTYMDSRVDRVVEGAGDALTGFAKFAYSLIDEDVCSHAPQLGGTHNFIPRRTTKDGQIGLYYVCEYCGKAYGDALEEAYQDYVETLPGTQYNSSGAFLWVPQLSDFTGRSIDCCLMIGSSSSVSYLQLSGSQSVSGNIVWTSVSSESVVLSVRDSTAVSDFYARWPAIACLPYTAQYVVPDGDNCWYAFNGVKQAGETIPVFSSVSPPSSPSSSALYVKKHSASGPFDFVLTCPQFWVIPLNMGSSFSSDSRVSSVDNSGLYGYVQDGQLYQSTVGEIYNETTNVYQNPVTGDTSNISSWQYDYSDRSYTLTTDEGDNVTVTYGDSNVTINEGGTTYNVYYLMEETDDVRDEIESRCDHDYTSTVTTAPTCTASGVRTYTCSECGASYAETIPATGHNYQSAVTMEPTCLNTGIRTFTCSNCGDSYTVSLPATGHVWEVVRTVPTTYDSDTGELVQRGYTLYQCSTCGEQYRIDADSGGSSLPAPSSGGVSTGTGAELMETGSDVGKGFLATIAHGLTEDLPEVLKAASEWFVEFPKFYGGFTSFLKEGIAGCLPDVPKMTMGFGFGMVTFIGIIRKIIGR